MFGHNSDQHKAHEEVQKAPHGAKLSHELIAAAASYEAAKAYQEHCERNGKPQSHQKAKEIFAGLAGAAVTHIVENKAFNHIDKQKAQNDAHRHAEEHIAKHY